MTDKIHELIYKLRTWTFQDGECMTFKFQQYYLGLFFILLSGCTTLNRSPGSGYASSNSALSNLNQNNQINLQIQQWMNEMGMTSTALQDPLLREKFQSLIQVKTLEINLKDDREKRQYYNIMPWLKNDDEKYEFLSKPGYAARQTWLHEKKIGTRTTQIDEDWLDIIEAKDIGLGMPQDFVRKSWGQPDNIEISGNPIYRNERWQYKRFISSAEGYKMQNRIVYFEGGKVAGWEQKD
jgi:hypothetical protein